MTRDSIAYNYGDLGGAKVAFSLQGNLKVMLSNDIVKYFNAVVGLALIRVAREYITLLATSLTFITNIKGKKVKLRQLHCSGTIKKSEVKARMLLSLWLNNVLKKVATNKSEEQELKKSIEKEFETLAAMEQ